MIRARCLFFTAVVLLGAVAPATAQTKNPLEDAKEGQWTLQKSTAAGTTTHVYQWVSKVDGKKITLRTQLLNADLKSALMAGTEAVVDLAAAPGAGGPEAKTSDDEVELNGKKLKCKRVEVTLGPTVSVTWTCAEVPVTGLVRAVTSQDGKEIGKLELVDFGASGGADKPVGVASAPPAGEPAGDAKDENQKTASLDGVTVTATRVGPMKTEAGTVVKGFFVFKVVAKNSNDAKKTLKGKITLQAADGSVAGECTIYMELPAGQQAEKELKCKETGPWEKFEAVIEKIFNF